MGRHNLKIVRTAKAASVLFSYGLFTGQSHIFESRRMTMPKLPVVIGVLEYGEVRLFESMDQVMREWGPYPADVASQVIVFYDADGVWLEPVFTRGRRLGLREDIKAFTLRRNTTPDASVDSIALALFEATSLAPNRHCDSLDELRARFPFSNVDAARIRRNE